MGLGPRVRALGYLGLQATVVHPLRRVFRRRGLREFLRSYGPDLLVPLHPGERVQLPAFMRCIACGLCDQVCPQVGVLPRREFSGPSRLALAWTRATPDLPATAGALRALADGCGTCRRCADVCPTRVPLRDLIDAARSQLERVERLSQPLARPEE